MIKKITLLACIFSSFFLQAQDGCIEYNEVNGLVIMEAEHTTSNLDKWIIKTDVADYKGSGHLEFTGNSIVNGPPNSPLQYTFQINQTAYFRILIRARKRIDNHGEFDKSNDCYIRVAGDFDPSPNAQEVNNGAASLEILKEDTKIFGGKSDEWGKAFTLDIGGHDGKRVPVYGFKAGETYTLTVSGRSKQFNIDRIVFYKNGTYNLNDDKVEIMDATPETSCERTLGTSTINYNKEFQIVSNPIKDKKLRITHTQAQDFKLYSLTGELLKEFSAKENTTIDLSNFTSGIYILQTEKSTAFHKIVIP